MTSTPVSTRAVIVTGASSGIGLETAVGIARHGYRVVATVRDLGRTDALTSAAHEAGVELDIRALDVTDAGSVSALVDGVVATYGGVHALVNNAGAAHVGTLELDPMEDIRATFEVNFFGVVAMSKAVMAHLRASNGVLISVSSVGGIVGQPFNEAYCAAKFALEGFMEGLAPVAATVGVRVCVVEPGAVASSFVSNAGIDPSAMIAAAGPYAPAAASYLARTAGAFANAQTSQDAAATIVSALVDSSTPHRVQTSDGARAFVGLKLGDLDGSAVQSLTGTWVAPTPA
jgi:NAD(P)-dependent dehydrogenase (short-subunit alcohol dehydrogenase family)